MIFNKKIFSLVLLHYFSAFFKIIAGDPRFFSLEHRIFSSIALVNGAANLFGSANYLKGINALLQMNFSPAAVLFAIHFISGLVLLSLYTISRFQNHYRSLFLPCILTIFVFLSINVLFNGASKGGAHYFFITAVLIAVILAPGKLYLVFSFFIGIFTVALMFWIEREHPELIHPFADRKARLADVQGAFIFMQVLNGFLVLILRRHFNEEREKSESLLLNILPEPVANELKQSDRVRPVHYQYATVLFTDFVEFTRFAENFSPNELIKELDACFREFDQIVKKYSLEKIKTIGDSYMTAGGLPEANTTNPIDATLAAIEMREYMNLCQENHQKLGRDYWKIRIGIHTGQLVAGVIGEKKFAYDIWGDTVNTASRMESSGMASKINVSAETYKDIKDLFLCTYRGKIQAKNKGMISMYFVERIHPEYSQDAHGRIPNDSFWEIYNKIGSGVHSPSIPLIEK